MSNDDLVLDGKTYVSSKRAAQLSQYAQDYIGQLCRAGTADCRRINGLWYVTMESLEKHKTTSAEVKAKAFENINADVGRNNYNDSVLSFSGEEYVSSRHAAELTGYNPDYVTQLARDGKIRGRQIGSRWYVSKQDLMSNKEKNDALLAAVQVESVGLFNRDEKPIEQSKSRPSAPELVYKADEGKALMPNLPEKQTPVIETPYTVVNPVAIKTNSAMSTPKMLIPQRKMQYNASSAALLGEERAKKTNKKGKSRIFNVVVVLVAVLIVGAGGYIGLKKSGVLASRGSSASMEAAAGSSGHDITGKLTDILIRLSTQVITYQRAQ